MGSGRGILGQSRRVIVWFHTITTAEVEEKGMAGGDHDRWKLKGVGTVFLRSQAQLLWQRRKIENWSDKLMRGMGEKVHRTDIRRNIMEGIIAAIEPGRGRVATIYLYVTTREDK